MLARQKIGGLLLIIAFGLLIPGLTEPVLQVITTLDKAQLASLGKEALLSSPDIPGFVKTMATSLFEGVSITGTVVIQATTKSILGTSETLWDEGNRLVAGLILLFSVIVPVFKGLLLLLQYGFKQARWGVLAGKLSGVLSKWSMTDVFVMALIVSFLAIKASAGASTLVETTITFEAGFYYFLGYCLFSIAGSQLLLRSAKTD